MMDYIYIYKKNADNTFEYKECVVSQVKHPELHHMMIVSNNYKKDPEPTNIDIESIQFKNYDATQYTDDQAIEREALELSAEVKDIKKLEDGTYHPLDLMAHKIQIHLEEENRKQLVWFMETDKKNDVLFKHYESLLAYNDGFETLIEKAQEYRQQEEYESKWVMKANEL